MTFWDQPSPSRLLFSDVARADLSLVPVRPHNLLTVENSTRQPRTPLHSLPDLLLAILFSISSFLHPYIDFAESVFLSWAVSCASYEHTQTLRLRHGGVRRFTLVADSNNIDLLTYKATTQDRSSQSFDQFEFHHPNVLALNTIAYINTYPALSFHRSSNGS